MKKRASGHKGTNWFHLDCFAIPEGMKVDHIAGFDDLPASDKDKAKATLRRAQEAAAQLEAAGGASSAEPKRQKTHPEQVAARGVAGRHAAAEEALHHVHPHDARFELTRSPERPSAAASAAAGGPSPSSSELRHKYERMNVAELLEVLRANEMLLSGSKEELVARCVEGEKRGAIPWCPLCRRGLLHVRHRAGGGMLYECPGYFDTVARLYISCPFQSSHVERKPWAMPGASETGERQKSPGHP